MAQDGMEKPERTIQDVLKEINDNLEVIIEAQKEMIQTLDDYIEHKEKIIEGCSEYASEIAQKKC